MGHHGAGLPEGVPILLHEQRNERIANAGGRPAVVTKRCTQHTHEHTQHTDNTNKQEDTTRTKYRYWVRSSDTDNGTGVYSDNDDGTGVVIWILVLILTFIARTPK